MVLILKIPKNFDKIKEEIEGVKKEMIKMKVIKKTIKNTAEAVLNLIK